MKTILTQFKRLKTTQLQHISKKFTLMLQVDDVDYTAAMTLDRLTISTTDGVTSVEASCGIIITIDGQSLQIELPYVYHSHVDGACGDYNGNPQNEFTNGYKTNEQGQSLVLGHG